MNQRPRSERISFGTLAVAAVAASILACPWIGAIAMAQESPPAPQAEAPESAPPPGDTSVVEEYEPLVLAQPIYPAAALRLGLEGDVTVSFTITADGTTSDIVAVESTSELLDSGALEAAGRSTFKPRTVDGEPVDVPGVTRTYGFRIQDISGEARRNAISAEQERARNDESWLPIVRKAPSFPNSARRQGITQAWVTVRYTVTAEGRVDDEEIVDASSTLFEKAALRAVRDFRYEPRKVDGLPIEVPEVTTRIGFDAGD
jgi:TonB family protein